MNQTRYRSADVDRNWLQPERFASDPIYCEAAVDNDDDILYRGSDDERYANPTERRLAYEKQARRFLEGKAMVLLSATLRGPFGKESGWVNPWRSRRTPATKEPQTKKRKGTTDTRQLRKRQRATEPQDEPLTQLPAQSGCHLPSPEGTAPLGYFDHQYLDGEAVSRVEDWAKTVISHSCGNNDSFDQPILWNHAEDDTADTSPRPRRSSGCSTLSSAVADADVDTPEISFTANVSNIADGHHTQETTGRLPQPLEGSQAVPSASEISIHRTRSSGTLQPSLCPFSPGRPSGPSGTPLFPAETIDFSPSAVRIYENAVKEARINGEPVQNQSPIKDKRKTPRSTPLVVVAAGLAPVQENADISFQTCSDRSFRFRSNAPQIKHKAKPRSSLAVAITDLVSSNPEALEADKMGGTGCTPMPSEPMVVDERIPMPTTETMDTDTEFPGQEVASDKAHICDEHDANLVEKISGPLSPRDPSTTSSQSVLPSQTIEKDVAATTSPTEFITIFPVGSSSRSPASNKLSLGTFSFEKESQSFLIDPAGMPRKLLWPRSQQTTKNTVSDPVHRPTAEPTLEPARYSLNVEDSKRQDEPELMHREQQNGGSVDGAVADPAQHPDKVPRPEKESIQDVTEEEVTELTVDFEAIFEQEESRGDLESSTDPSSHLSEPREQRPWAKETVEIQHQAEHPEVMAPKAGTPGESPNKQPQTMAHGVGTPGGSPKEQPKSPSKSPSETQSPWAQDLEIVHPVPEGTSQQPTPRLKPTSLSLVANQALEAMDQQSPWAKGDSQITACIQPRVFNPISSPAMSPCIPGAPNVGFPSPKPPANENTETPNTLYLPSTPERYNSSLPTPEFTLSIKSFREFMTPSPAKRVPLGPTDSNGRLPSTQLLAETTISNPWTKSSNTQRTSMGSCLSGVQKRKRAKKAKRVSWALPDEDDSTLDKLNSTHLTSSRGTITVATGPPHAEPVSKLRAASPPPSALKGSEELPGENEKFGKHFAVMAASRRRRIRGIYDTPMLRVRKSVQLLPSASQQICPSPAEDAMAAAFIQADEEAGRGSGAEDGQDGEDIGREDHLEETDGLLQVEMEETEESVDDVTTVLENLDEFLNTWDVDTELAKARAEKRREERERIKDHELGSNDIAMAAGLVDIGVWD